MAKNSSLTRTIATIVTTSALTLSVAVGAVVNQLFKKPKIDDGSGNNTEIINNGEGNVAKSIDRVEKTNSYGLIDEYTIFYTDETTSVFIVTNGSNGEPGIQGFPGIDGHTPEITIGTNGNWLVDGVDTGTFATGPKGDQGEPGLTPHIGSEGHWWIGDIDTGIIAEGHNGKTPLVGANGNWWIGGTDTGVCAYGLPGPEGPEGRGIASINKTDSQGLVDIYTITYTDGTTSEFLVTNGANGETAAQGLPGQDGHTPEITIGTNGNWIIDGVDTEVHAQGPQGEQGIAGTSLKTGEGEPLSELGMDGDSYIDTNSWNYYVKTNGAWELKGNIKGESNAGNNGLNGKSAYEIAVDNGYTGTEAEWLASLIGEAGANGDIGNNGKSAYELAVENGFDGTEEEWLITLIGPEGAAGAAGQDGKSVYELAIENGFTGSLTEWLTTLVGDKGEQGQQGQQGEQGKSAYDLAVENGYSGTLEQWLSSLAGEDGVDGVDGVNGKSAYELAVENGFTGTFAEWIVSLHGQDGATGQDGKSAYELAVENGFTGTFAEWMISLQGQNGADGSALRTGNGEPTADLGIDGDSFIDLSSFNYYVKEAGSWVLKGNIKGEAGDNGISIVSVEKTNTNGLIDTYTITYSDGNESTFTVTNGVQGADGNTLIIGTGAPTDETTANIGDSYIDVSEWKLYVKGDDSWTDKGTFKGDKGDQGEQGVSITDIAYDSSSGLVDTYLISYSDGTNDTFAVTNGQDGTSLKTGYGNPNTASVDDPSTTVDETRADPITGIEGDSFLDLHSWDYYVLEQGSEGLEWVFKGNIHNIPDTYEVSFDTDGGSETPANQTVQAGYGLNKPVDPQKPDYYFQGWFTTDGRRWDFDKDVPTRDIVLTAHWSQFKVVDGVLVETTATGDVVIPSYFDEQFVNGIGENVFKDKDNIDSVFIPSSVTFISESAFENCTSLLSISIPSSIDTIGNNAFKGCSNLAYVLLSEGLDSIGEYAFENCTSLKNLSIPSSVVEIGFGAFKGCSSLSTISLRYLLKAGEAAGPTKYSYGNGAPSASVKSEYYFDITSADVYYYNETSSEWTKVMNFNEMAGSNPDAIAYGAGEPDSSVTADAYVDYETFDVYMNTGGGYQLMFNFCTELDSIYGGGGGSFVQTFNHFGRLFGAESPMDQNDYVPASLKTVVITEGAGIYKDNIPDLAFYGLKNIQRIVLPNGLKKIGRMAFANCDSIEEFVVPDSVETISEGAFIASKGWTKYGNIFEMYSQKIIFSPNGNIDMKYIHDGDILVITNSGYGNSGINMYSEIEGNFITLSSVWNGGLQYYEGAFAERDTLAPSPKVGELYRSSDTEQVFVYTASGWVEYKVSVSGYGIYGDMPAQGTYHGELYLCSEDPYYNEYMPDPHSFDVFSWDAVENKWKLMGTNLFDRYRITPEFSDTDPDLNSADSKNLNALHFNIKTGDMFVNCASKLKSLTLPFTGTSQTIKSGREGILYAVFAEAMSNRPYDGYKYIPFSLKTVYLTEGNVYNGEYCVGPDAFSCCCFIENVILSQNITNILDGAFTCCRNLKAISFRDGLKSIGMRAFQDTGLEAVALPASVEKVGYEAFAMCQKLTAFFKNGGHCSFEGSICSYDYVLKYFVLDCTIGTLPECPAFVDECENVEYLTLGYGIKEIDCATFANTVYNDNHLQKLITIVIPESVEVIGKYAFAGCVSLKNINIPANVIEIGDCAFRNCTSLKSITLPEHLKYICSASFFGCTGLTFVTIPDSVISIGAGAFFGCDNLESLTLPFIGSFSNTADFENADIYYAPTPGYLCYEADIIKLIGNNTKDNDIFIETEEGNGRIWKKINGHWHRLFYATYSNGGSSRYWYIGEGEPNLTNPDSLKFYLDLTTRNVYTFKYVSATHSYESVLRGKFEEYFTRFDILFAPFGDNYEGYSGFIDYGNHVPNSLKNVTITKGVHDSSSDEYFITSNSFRNATSIETIHLGKDINRIDTKAFKDCSSLAYVTFEDKSNLKTISERAFEDCSNLKQINVPNSVTSIGSMAFLRNASITSMTLPFVGDGSVDHTNFGYIFGTLDNNEEDTSETGAKIPESLKNVTVTGGTSIAGSAFMLCQFIESIVLPDSVSSIGAAAFGYCTSLTSVKLPNNENYTTIDYGTFDSCKSLRSINIPNSVTTILGGAFNECTALESLVIPNSVTNIDAASFIFCSALRFVTLPNNPGFTSIQLSTFYGCTSLQSIIIPNSVTSIGDTAFAQCNSLQSIVIPNSVTTVGSGAFMDCTSLQSVVLPNNASYSAIAENTFNGCSSLLSIYIPNNVTAIKEDAFNNCFNLMTVRIHSNITTYGDNAFKNCVMISTVIYSRVSDGALNWSQYVDARDTNNGNRDLLKKSGATFIYRDEF